MYIVLSLFFFAFTFVIARRNNNDCTVTSADGSFYDLSPLSQMIISAADSEGKWDYNISVCVDIIQNCSTCDIAGYCQSNKDTTNCIGNYNPPMKEKSGGSGVEILYGLKSNINGKVTISCSNGGSLVSNKKATTPPDNKNFEFTFDSSAGCTVCSKEITCDSCLSDKNCSWCNDNNSCVGSKTKTCQNIVTNPSKCET